MINQSARKKDNSSLQKSAQKVPASMNNPIRGQSNMEASNQMTMILGNMEQIKTYISESSQIDPFLVKKDSTDHSLKIL